MKSQCPPLPHAIRRHEGGDHFAPPGGPHPLFLEHVLEYGLVQRQIGDGLAEPLSLLLELLDPPQLCPPCLRTASATRRTSSHSRPSLRRSLATAVPCSAWRRAWAICCSV